MNEPAIYGLMAEFDTPDEIVAAAKRTHAAGYREIDAYSPYPVEELWEAIGFHHNRVALVVLIGGLIGCMTGYGLQYWVANIAYPTNIGGRPFHSWPSFMVVTFELTILFSVLSAVVGMLALNGLPLPYHPVFNVERFSRVTEDKFFLVFFSSDAKFSVAETRTFLRSLGAKSVEEVPS